MIMVYQKPNKKQKSPIIHFHFSMDAHTIHMSFIFSNKIKLNLKIKIENQKPRVIEKYPNYSSSFIFSLTTSPPNLSFLLIQ